MRWAGDVTVGARGVVWWGPRDAGGGGGGGVAFAWTAHESRAGGDGLMAWRGVSRGRGHRIRDDSCRDADARALRWGGGGWMEWIGPVMMGCGAATSGHGRPLTLAAAGLLIRSFVLECLGACVWFFSSSSAAVRMMCYLYSLRRKFNRRLFVEK